MGTKEGQKYGAQFCLSAVTIILMGKLVGDIGFSLILPLCYLATTSGIDCSSKVTTHCGNTNSRSVHTATKGRAESPSPETTNNESILTPY